MCDGRKYIIITPVIPITNMVVSKEFYCMFLKSPFTLAG